MFGDARGPESQAESETGGRRIGEHYGDTSELPLVEHR